MLVPVEAKDLRIGDIVRGSKVESKLLYYIPQTKIVRQVYVHCEGDSHPQVFSPETVIWQERGEEVQNNKADVNDLTIVSCIEDSQALAAKLKQYSAIRNATADSNGKVTLGTALSLDKSILVSAALKEVHDIGNRLKQQLGRL